MDITLTIFAGSFAGIVAVLMVKLYHLKVRRDLFFHGVCQKIDGILKKNWEKFKIEFSRLMQKLSASVEYFITVVLKGWLINLFQNISRSFHRARDYYIKGKRELNPKSTASFYLRDVSEFKNRK